ncbi:hypothetical protein HYS93_03785 [Candidatus Daviesbacteria bacterium]|nr:hypothetical protein [Candidatus Daviesbacteria bacterium]
MAHLPITILAYFFNSIAVTIDKLLLSKAIKDPLVYVFYFSMVSMLTLLLIPFTHLPNFAALALASVSTLFWTAGAYLMFSALRIGLVSRVIPFIGTLIPIFLLFQAATTNAVTISQAVAVIVLILGLVFLSLPNWEGIMRGRELILVVLSALFFATSYLFLREAYLEDQFLTVFVYSKPILIPLGLLILVVPSLRERVFPKDKLNAHFSKLTLVIFVSGQLSAGLAELLLTFSISLANPALVNSLQGVQYAFLFIFSLFLAKKLPQVFKEKLNFYSLISKISGLAFLAVGLYVLAFTKS